MVLVIGLIFGEVAILVIRHPIQLSPLKCNPILLWTIAKPIDSHWCSKFYFLRTQTARLRHFQAIKCLITKTLIRDSSPCRLLMKSFEHADHYLQSCLRGWPFKLNLHASLPFHLSTHLSTECQKIRLLHSIPDELPSPISQFTVLSVEYTP